MLLFDIWPWEHCLISLRGSRDASRHEAERNTSQRPKVSWRGQDEARPMARPDRSGVSTKAAWWLVVRQA